MKPSIEKKLTNLATRYDELKAALAEPDVTNDLNRYRELSKEFSQIEPFVKQYEYYQSLLKQMEESNALLEEDDPELQQLAKLDIKQIEENLAGLENDLMLAMLPKDPHDENNIFLEIRAGAGGD